MIITDSISWNYTPECAKVGGFLKICQIIYRAPANNSYHSRGSYSVLDLKIPPAKIAAFHYKINYRDMRITLENSHNTPNFIGVITPKKNKNKLKDLLKDSNVAFLGNQLMQQLYSGKDGLYVAINPTHLFPITNNLDLISQACDIVEGNNWDHLEK